MRIARDHPRKKWLSKPELGLDPSTRSGDQPHTFMRSLRLLLVCQTRTDRPRRLGFRSPTKADERKPCGSLPRPSTADQESSPATDGKRPLASSREADSAATSSEQGHNDRAASTRQVAPSNTSHAVLTSPDVEHQAHRCTPLSDAHDAADRSTNPQRQ